MNGSGTLLVSGGTEKVYFLFVLLIRPLYLPSQLVSARLLVQTNCKERRIKWNKLRTSYPLFCCGKDIMCKSSDKLDVFLK